MKITLLGYASLLIELDGATCLMDPVFADPFEEGAVESCPKRVVRTDRIPPVDMLIVSHRHPDHFDIASLARVSRDVDAIFPADPQIAYALDKLGFTRLHPVHPMAPIRSEGFELFPTRSEVKTVKEFGMVFRDRTGTVWNQVDTFLSDGTIRAVRDRFGDLDVLFDMYASQNFEYFESGATSLPIETHRRNLETAVRIAPRCVIPGSAGFCFTGDHAWLNAFVFPISRERFVTDLGHLDPGLQTVVINPSDIVELTRGEVRHGPGESELAVMEADDTDRIRFDPTAPVPELADPNPEGVPGDRLADVTGRFITEGLRAYVDRGYLEGDRVIDLYRQFAPAYAVGIVFPDGALSWFRFEFGPDRPHLQETESALEADLVHKIAASALLDWLEHRRSFFYVRAYSRRYATLCTLRRDGDAVGVEPRPLPDLLMHYLLNVAEGSEVAAKELMDRQIASALGQTKA